ncbi:hypothetical protein XU18_2031 [Perkinsela sp. CCAP 1560/4]|nr:hypothetical protein XU18_2031 [Perkinsela sp. CCAP 1560/4]|eukprot:KNH07499.1 hypothetical protein XU18_2031 [Perkinsela sp. CCAP 1560/4]
MSGQKDDSKKSDAMRELWLHSLSLSPPDELTNSDYISYSGSVNPLLVDFPRKCVRTIKSDEEARDLLKKSSSNSEIAIVQYTQNNCTACNALSKISEFLCHSMTKTYPRLHFFEVNREDAPRLTRDMIRYPQIKGYSQGSSLALDYKPPVEFRQHAQEQIKKEITHRKASGKPVNALQAEEMYYSVSAPAIAVELEESVCSFYTKSQVDLHDYWGQVSRRRSWFYKKFIAAKSENSNQKVDSEPR